MSDLSKKGPSVEHAVPAAMAVLSQLADPPKADKVPMVANTWIALLGENGVDADELTAAVPVLLKRHEFWPKPKQVLEACMKVKNDRAWREWCDSQRRFQDRLALERAPLPLSERPDRDEFLRIRDEARQKLGVRGQV